MGKRISFLTPILLIFTLVVRVFSEVHRFKVNEVVFKSDKIPAQSGVTVLQISDLHNRAFGKGNKRLVHAVKEAKADLIVITGDLISKDTKSLRAVFSFIEKVVDINKHVFFISGNHDWANYQNEVLFAGLAKRNVKVLHNDSVQWKKGNFVCNIVGIDDASTDYEDMEAAFANIDKDAYTIFLSHTPDIVKKYNDIPANLILSGHTHGGQVRFPIIGAVIAPDQGFFPKLDKGVFEIGSDQSLYIDSGLGTSRAPLRFLNRSQLSLIRIESTL
ncbi:metallophosphoesterase [Aciduricibacillus chroicocephali]|uniref:Metallophosphoesterase n=1 Tax=Aciduricibacillus chroicocephali TaxID=3054939 RepID=A0ABY9KWU0_9BACI|nr:metallophosphoesterase [Bacillaceae bacterium 44XB]